MACVSGVVLLANPLPVRSSHLRDTGRERGEGKVRLSIAARTRDTGKQGEALDRRTRAQGTPESRVRLSIAARAQGTPPSTCHSPDKPEALGVRPHGLRGLEVGLDDGS
jgi:hypothetical protein